MQSSDFSRHAESMTEFVKAKSKQTVGPVHRPGFISRKQKMCIIALGLILSPFLVKKIVSGNTLLHDKNIWMAGSIFVYFFSVSGTMYNIINKIPIAMVDRDDPGKLVFFYDGSGMQLGAEGFTVGFLCMIFKGVVGLCHSCSCPCEEQEYPEVGDAFGNLCFILGCKENILPV